MGHKAMLTIRWSARVTGLLLVGLVLVFVIGEGPPNPLRQPPSVQAELLGMLLMLAGFLVGWLREGLGGMLAIAGFAVFVGTELVVNGHGPGGTIALFVVPGLLFLVADGLAVAERRSAVGR